MLGCFGQPHYGSPCRSLAAFWAKFWGAKAFWGLGQALVRVRRLQHTELRVESEARASREPATPFDFDSGTPLAVWHRLQPHSRLLSLAQDASSRTALRLIGGAASS